jgi:hypothetical protein
MRPAQGDPMGMFDQTARQACKLDGGPFFAWLLRHCEPPPPLEFEGWDDARRQPLPGGADRTDDVLAVLRRTDVPDQRCWMIVEAETEPERLIFQRLGNYALLLSLELSQASGPADEPPVGMALLNLTGQQRGTALRLVLPGTGCGLTVAPLVLNLRQLDAAATLAEMAAGQTGLCVLPWVPLMAGAGEPARIEEWKRLVLLEPDAERRGKYRELGLVFAELAKELVNWQRALEGWQVQESQVILGWINRGVQRGVVETRRAVLLQVLETRFQAPVPETVRLAVEGTNDPDTLKRWFDAALVAPTLAEFLATMRRQP